MQYTIFQQVIHTNIYIQYEVDVDIRNTSKELLNWVSPTNITNISFVEVSDNFNNIKKVKNFTFRHRHMGIDGDYILDYFKNNPLKSWTKFFEHLKHPPQLDECL